jgi:hypothetical protein
MRRLLLNIILLFVAITLLATIGVFGIIYAIVFSIIQFKTASPIRYWADILYQINLGIDQIGNVLLSKFLNHFALVNYETYPFGKVRMTISHVLAVNYYYNNLKKFGMWLLNLLEWLDPGHTDKSLYR